ncbi:SDR family NAD(P)-dependent oxidoreductase [Sneathiella sp. HT1-7]|jgi:3-oxoacyl-[acyl-carrier protein] reductase|uniref:SDR family NAD(P)-dependent oxidoreductase n=1 Tax=Sneathiella sp. HT1-7 TaxID=2887192 RepID=UPI001D133460|nr:SDR family NAD(P)-dependent oxidoreductase [Sneathiella sp. HT1-7]MCC3306573.1 SDR family oxidoreductase [Sneathiella sp. HT1-7]
MYNPMSLEGRNIIVTGAGQGVGAAAAEMIVNLGGRAILVDLQEDKLQAVADKLGSDNAEMYVGSVADPGFVQDMVTKSVASCGGVHGLINNAGIVRAAMINKMPVETWQQVIDVNLSGVFYCLQAVGRHMIERVKDGDKNPGAIVNISSVAGRRGTVGQINYGAAKSGVLGITMSAAKEWGRYGIRVNSACFGVVETEMTETIRSDKFRDTYMAQVVLERFASPEEVAKGVCFLLTDASSYVTGQHLSIDGGLHIGF